MHRNLCLKSALAGVGGGAFLVDSAEPWGEWGSWAEAAHLQPGPSGPAPGRWSPREPVR